MKKIEEFFKIYPKVAIACSGGVDSTFLLYQAKIYGKDIKAYFVQSAFQPAFELKDARKFCEQLEIELKVIHVDVLSMQKIISNPKDRCYHCKKIIFGEIKKLAEKEGYEILLEGTNASDDINDRPGMKALAEYEVMSPLREYGYTKTMIRDLSRQAGLFPHNKPSYACLATRIPCGITITKDLLTKIEQSENILFSFGFTDFRIRIHDGAAKIQLKEEEMNLFLSKRKEIITVLEDYFQEIFLDVKTSR